MPEFEIGWMPDVMFHGTSSPGTLLEPCPPAASSRRWGAIPWEVFDDEDDHEAWMEARNAVPNIVWEALGLRDPDRSAVPEWARDVRDFDDLGQRVGILFVTDADGVARAESLYGPTVEINMAAPQILDVVEDPNVQTHAGFILLIRAGEPLPLRDPEAVRALAAGGGPRP